MSFQDKKKAARKEEAPVAGGAKQAVAAPNRAAPLQRFPLRKGPTPAAATGAEGSKDVSARRSQSAGGASARPSAQTGRASAPTTPRPSHGSSAAVPPAKGSQPASSPKQRPSKGPRQGDDKPEPLQVDAPPQLDSYGQPAPTDRLQFGYAPAVLAEAVAFHSMIPSAEWIAARRKWLKFFLKKSTGELTSPHPDYAQCEPIESFFKLKAHWRQGSMFRRGLGEGAVTGGAATDSAPQIAAAEKFMSFLAAQQHKPAVAPTPQVKSTKPAAAVGDKRSREPDADGEVSAPRGRKSKQV